MQVATAFLAGTRSKPLRKVADNITAFGESWLYPPKEPKGGDDDDDDDDVPPARQCRALLR